MAASSIDVIEEVLGDRLFARGWTARSFAEIDASDPAYRVPAISHAQYRTIQSRLHAHWNATAQAMRGDRGTLLIGSRLVTRLHTYLDLVEPDPLSRLTRRSARDLSVMVKPQLTLDDAMIARKALLYSPGVTMRDPAELIRAWPRRANLTLPGVLADQPPDAWKDYWYSAVCGLGTVHRLVQSGIIALYPAGTLLHKASLNHSGKFARREREQQAELAALYRTDAWTSVLKGLPFDDWEEAGIYGGWTLGQFAWRNVVLPGATPWIPDAKCLATLAGIERALKARLLEPESVTVARLSSQRGIDIGKVSDGDIIAMRQGEELFAMWRRLVADLTMEVDRLGLDSSADVTTLVRAKQVLWRTEFDRHTGRGTVLSGLFDANPVVCGVITGATALASGMSGPLTAASALGGGLVTPLLRLMANLRRKGGREVRSRAVQAHFMALEGTGA